MKNLVLSLVLFLCEFFLIAQQTTFIRTYGDVCPDFGMSVCNNNSGGYILCGQSENYTSGAISMVAISIDSAGNQEWLQAYGGSSYDFGQSIDKTDDGGYILCGFTSSYGAGDKDIYLVRTDSAGNQLWQKTFGGSGTEYGYCVKKTADKGFIICGSTTSFGSGGTDAMLIKTDSAGNSEWTKYFGGTANDGVYSLAITTDGGYVLAGYTYNFGAVSGDAWVFKTDSAGNHIWDNTFGSTGSERAMSIIQTADENFIFCGYSDSYGSGSMDYYLVRLNSSGMLLQDTVFGGLSDDKAFGIAACSDHGFILTGQTESIGNGGTDLYVIKTDSAFNIEWDNNYGGYDDDQGFYIMPTADGGYITIGNTWSYCTFGFFYSDIFVVKLDSTGFADGISDFSRQNSEVKIFPNPATDYISVETGVTNENVFITISDATGRIVLEHEFTDKTPVIKVSQLSGGLYTLNIITKKANSSAMFVKQ
ncbi:hypothetical protein SDC9_47511 [bioreactor metagenome]|uniref:Secretion system C-terminal sorting domain-containing protein n=1 Tax=bioreactor metagenome TaxID=1076179 RepID=A0A644WC02_9ZZZZ